MDNREKHNIRAHLVTTNRCNYCCPYCFASKGSDLFQPVKLADTLKQMYRLYGRWRFHLTGGEPFCHPGLDDITDTIRATGHSIGIVTNLSAEPSRLRTWITIAGSSLQQMSASFHPDMMTLSSFTERVDTVLEVLGPERALGVTMLVQKATHNDRLRLIEAMNERGVGVKVRIPGNAVSCEERRAEPDGDELRWPENLTCTGKSCWAGARYVWIDVDGAVYRCVNDSIAGLAPFGQLNPEFRLAERPVPCGSTRSCCLNPRRSGLIIE